MSTLDPTTPTALVTGGSRGIGRAIALKLAENGADVAINYAGNTAAAEEVKTAIEQMGRKALLVQGSVADTDGVQTIVNTVVKELGRLDILINNAGITRDGLLMRMKEADWDDVMHTNLKGVYNCSKAVLRTMMKQRSGQIVNMASVVGEMGNAGQSRRIAGPAARTAAGISARPARPTLPADARNPQAAPRSPNRNWRKRSSGRWATYRSPPIRPHRSSPER